VSDGEEGIADAAQDQGGGSLTNDEREQEDDEPRRHKERKARHKRSLLSCQQRVDQFIAPIARMV
jgi:hypothetical protein